MNHFQFESRLTLSEDGKMLIIENKKMNTNPKYRFEKTPQEVREERERMRAARDKGEETTLL